MGHKLLRVKSKLLNTPHLIDEASFEAILEYVNKRVEGTAEITSPEASSGGKGDGFSNRYLFNEDTQTAVMFIDGPLTNKATGWESFCGGTSYEGLKLDFEEAIERGVKTVSFMASSGGGEAGGMIDSANYIRSLATEHGVKIITYVEDVAASACYGLACISDEIIAQSDSEVGSIGVLVRLVNNSKEQEKVGRETTYITAGKSKVPFGADGSWDESFLADIQYKVNTIYEDFTSHVALHRNMSVESVKNTEAKTFLAKDAMDKGLVDKVMTVEQYYSYLADVSQQRSGEFKTNTSRIFKTETNEEIMKLAEMEASLEAANTKLTEAQASIVELTELKTQLSATITEKDAALAVLSAQVEEMAGEKEKAKLEVRKASLSAVVAQDKLEATLSSMSALDDAAFATIVDSMSASKTVAEQSALFVEIGGDEEVTTEATDTAVDYTKAALAARIK